jgi:hypothetical protein
MKNVTQRSVELLQEDAERNRQAAEAWSELEKHNARLEDPDGRQVASASKMVEFYRRREKETRDLIKKVKGG